MTETAGGTGITDIHAHPSLNSYLFGRDLRKHYFSGRTFNPLSSLSDFKMLEKGDVRVLWSALLVPEEHLFRCRLLRLVAHLLPGGRKVRRMAAWECLLDMMREMEAQVARDDRFAVARSFAELNAILESGRRAIVHTVEGAHMLEGDASRVRVLAERGVASMTLAHLFPNGAVGHTEGIPEDLRRFPLCPLPTGVDESRGVNAFGESVVEELVRHRVIPDVTHTTVPSRERIFEIVGKRIPVIASHSGAYGVNPVRYNMRDVDIQAIEASGGVVGVILMPSWLHPRKPGPGLEAIWATMRHIADMGGWHTVAIGTDFDGFTDPPDDVKDSSKLPRIRDMLTRRGLTASQVDGVVSENARRVLRDGWR